MTEVEVAVKKTPSVQQIYGRKSTRSKSPKKSRTRSPYKRDASPKRPSPGRSSLRDSRGDLKWDESGMGDGPQQKTKTKAPASKNATGEKSALLQKEQELNKTLSEEIVNLATTASKADATGVEVPAVEDDIYTEVQSDVHQVEIPPIKEVIEQEPPRVTEMYSTFPRESPASLERTSLQKLLVQAELDLKTLDFTNPAAVDRFMMLSRDIRVKMNVLKEANFDVQRLEEQRDAVVERLVKTDSETAIMKSELKHKEQDLAGLRVDTEIEREKAERLNAKVAHLEDVKAKIQRELFSREGELNRSQARERSTKKTTLGYSSSPGS
ncbi:Oidioi.mRNA.OKI2018_I69.chr2.g6264.t2.cds [Oikopleura dioica]|uniref:Oidioi.mRNA.OKI2018_I69.chr2.g6264.t2.cds n=1 Tax=Oikopleura dioica TaxID=34765 RepID=A0ABN7T317_OIKDI|nr:Oidioi.mRNA.OKI2018_I69.chr2.g6264.t2.cds [Oikopleura dioica]